MLSGAVVAIRGFEAVVDTTVTACNSMARNDEVEGIGACSGCCVGRGISPMVRVMGVPVSELTSLKQIHRTVPVLVQGRGERSGEL